MSNLLFLRRSYEYRYAAATAFRKARALPVGSERDMARVLARGLRDLARTEAWLEGDRSRRQHLQSPLTPPSSEKDMSDVRSRKTSEQS
jgi:hypothetical protein